MKVIDSSKIEKVKNGLKAHIRQEGSCVFKYANCPYVEECRDQGAGKEPLLKEALEVIEYLQTRLDIRPDHSYGLEYVNRICPKCGSGNYMRLLPNPGFYRYKCINCNSYFTSEDLDKKEDKVEEKKHKIDCDPKCKYYRLDTIGADAYGIFTKSQCMRAPDIDGKLQYVEDLDECPLITETKDVECIICHKIFKNPLKYCNMLDVYVCDDCRNAVESASEYFNKTKGEE